MATLVLLACAWPCAAAEQPRRPNVLFITIDDLNDWVGFLGGHAQVQTPHLDALAARGVAFTNAHCQAPLCNPSRTSLLTGLRPSTTGVYALDTWFRDDPRFRDWVTLPQYLARLGYVTLTTGKVFHDAFPPARDRDKGAEVTVWGYHGRFGLRPKERLVPTPTPVPLVDWGVFPARDEEQDDWKVADWAIRQLQSPPKQPFFLAVGFRHPHFPCYATQKWFDLYPEKTLKMPAVKDDDRADVPRFAWYLHWKLPEPRLEWLKQHHQWKPLVRSYLASISFVDSQVGRVVQALADAGLAKKTLVIVCSDHGFHLGEKGISGKNTLWERSTRVPLLFVGPGIRAGGKCQRPVELLDIYPTLVDLCGGPPQKRLEGHSLAPLLRDERAPRPWPAVTTHGPNNHAVRSERHRYIRYADGSEELYDLQVDAREWTNLAGDPRYAEVKRLLREALPRASAAPLPGGQTRLLEMRGTMPYWEGRPIGPDDPVPED
jgi:arylsulfatase A-like enzyme